MDVPGWSGRDLEVISGLRRLGDSGTPDDAARERIRGEILSGLTGDRTPSRRRRVLAEVLAAAVGLVIALGGLGLLLSRNALPGDTLYGIKRAGESAELGLAFGDAAKAQKHLEFASTRLDELAVLGSAPPDAYDATLGAFQHEATAGTAYLTEVATQGSGEELSQLRSWSLAQQAKLTAARPVIPRTAASQLTSSAQLLSRIEARAQILLARLDCDQITTGQTDELGAVPQSGSCAPPAGTVTGGVAPVPPAPAEEPLPARRTPATATRPPPAPTPTTSTPPTVSAPPAAGAPVLSPTSPRMPPSTTSTPPPAVSVPPLFPGLPGVGIG